MPKRKANGQNKNQIGITLAPGLKAKIVARLAETGFSLKTWLTLQILLATEGRPILERPDSLETIMLPNHAGKIEYLLSDVTPATAGKTWRKVAREVAREASDAGLIFLSRTYAAVRKPPSAEEYKYLCAVTNASLLALHLAIYGWESPKLAKDRSRELAPYLETLKKP